MYHQGTRKVSNKQPKIILKGTIKKTNKTDKTLATLIKKNEERAQINQIRNEKEKLQPMPQKYKSL